MSARHQGAELAAKPARTVVAATIIYWMTWESLAMAEGKPVLGTWQQIFHLECDVRPRKRTVVVTSIGE